VSDAVEQQVETLLGIDAVRLAGADRYDTAAAIAEYGFPTATSVFVASGEGFADALSGGAPAGMLNRPLLLTAPTQLSPATSAQISRLGNPEVIVLGGPTAVSDAVVGAIDALTTGTVLRVSGRDRYITGVLLSQLSFASAQQVMLVTGTDFPDALSAGPVGARRAAPILLTRSACVPQVVATEIARLGATTVIVVGGTRAVSTAAASLTVCVPPPPPTTTTAPPPPPPPAYGRYCRNGAPIRAVNTSKRIISFTFDDGPWPSHTANVMSTMERYGWRATFFVIGSNVRTYPDIARSIVRRGHLIANHSMTHSYSPSTIAAQVPTTRQLIYDTTGVWTTYFRSPGLTLSSTINNAVFANNSCNVSTDVDLGDWRSPRASASTLCARFRNSLHPGMIVLLHDGGTHQQTVNALPCMLDYVRAAGYQVVPLGTLLREGLTVGVRLQSALDGLEITE
jgi:peptidoglycan/xylan/chitin deacetylase (PgdA/CDA1 family)